MTLPIYSHSISGVKQSIYGTVTDTTGGALDHTALQVAVALDGTIPSDVGQFKDPDTCVNTAVNVLRFSVQIGGPTWDPAPGVYMVWYKLVDDPDEPAQPLLTFKIEVL